MKRILQSITRIGITESLDPRESRCISYIYTRFVSILVFFSHFYSGGSRGGHFISK